MDDYLITKAIRVTGYTIVAIVTIYISYIIGVQSTIGIVDTGEADLEQSRVEKIISQAKIRRVEVAYQIGYDDCKQGYPRVYHTYLKQPDSSSY